jgi:pyruvate/2-oxoglutarate dehydrogenase complex dihydrolipoamide dehydrogenase (E3) component
VAASEAAQRDTRVVLIEKEQQPGGDCLHSGCVPVNMPVHLLNRWLP